MVTITNMNVGLNKCGGFKYFIFSYCLCHLHPLKNNCILNKNDYVGISHSYFICVRLYYLQRYSLI